MFNEINEGGFNQLLTSRFGMQGGAAAPAVAPEVFPVVTLENDRPEFARLKGESLRSRLVIVGSVAGQFSQAQLYIPTNRNTIATVVAIQNVGTNVVNIARAPISGGIAGWAAANTGPRDLREGGIGAGVLLETVANAAAPSPATLLARLTTTITQTAAPFVLGPSGSSLFCYGDTVNTALQIVLWWYERTGQPGELV